jgi:glycosyltransferase involved in cell wall biosynthesis
MDAYCPILHVYQDFGAFGGIERVLLQLATGMRRRWEAGETPYYPVVACSAGGRLASALQDAGCDVVSLRTLDVFRRPTIRFLDAPSLFQLDKHIRRTRPALVHAHIGHFEHLWLKAQGLTVLLTMHGYGTLYHWQTEETEPTAQLKRWVKRQLSACIRVAWGQLDGMTFVSQAERQRLMAQGYLDAETSEASTAQWVVPNGLDIASWQASIDAIDRQEARKKLGVSDPSIRIIGFINRLDDNKNPLAFVSALQQLTSMTNTPLVGFMAGDGPLFHTVRQAVDMSAVPIRLLGHCQTVQPLFAAADVLVHPASMEGFGMGVLEALAAGVPCFAYPVGGVDALLNFPSSSPERRLRLEGVSAQHLAQALAQWLAQPPEQIAMQKRLKEQAQLFDEQAFLDKMLLVYDQILTKRRLSPISIPPLLGITTSQTT